MNVSNEPTRGDTHMTTFLGTSDDITSCECCGKKNLKRTVALDLTGDGAVVHYGVDCASKALTGSKKGSSIILHKSNAVAAARKALADGHDPVKVAKVVWNKYGYLSGVKNGSLYIGTFAEIPLP